MPTKRKSVTSKWLLIFVGLSYLFLILLLPAINVFYEAFHGGIAKFLESFKDADLIQAIILTVTVALIAVPLNTIFGLCAAWVLARNRFPGRALFLSILDLPFSVSPIVVGLMLVLLYGRNGWFGPILEQADIKIIFALPGIVLATAFVTMPFVAREVIPVLEEMGSQQEESARILGANDWQIFWRIIVPNIRLALIYGVLLTNARAMGEFGAVAVVSGSILGQTATLPIYVEQAYKDYHTQSAFAAAVILALLGVFTLIIKEFLERKGQLHSHSNRTNY
ncbi:MAG: sulfate ABC transporter permease subunit CysW [Cyanobacteriota bacterium ELA615]